MQASHQWRTRPADERFTSLLALQSAVTRYHDGAHQKTLPSKGLSVHAVGTDHKSLVVAGPNGGEVIPTHWAFGQMAGLGKAPAKYLRTLPSELAADNLNYGLQFAREVEDVKVLLYKNGGPAELRAVTGEKYGRIWNKDIVNALVSRFGDGLNGDFRVPGEFGKAVEVTKNNTTLYASDRDMFVFLADEKNRIEMKNRRNGKSGSLARGFFMWNSEVGASSFGIALFLFDYACCNRIVWGAEQVQEIRVRHTASAETHLQERIIPALDAYSESSTAGVVQAIEAAQHKRVDDLDKFLKARSFNKAQVEALKQTHIDEEGRPIESLWDVTTAITAYARDIPYQDQRVGLERIGGKILAEVTKTLPTLPQSVLDGESED
jgi:hypothetical protein